MTESSATYDTTNFSACALCEHQDAGGRCACEESPYYRYWTVWVPGGCELRKLPALGTGLAETEEGKRG